MTTDTPTFMQTLKDSTSELHRAAEGTAFQQTLMRGQLPREFFVESLAQLRLIHRALETQLRKLLVSHPQTAKIVNDGQFNESNLDADLAYLDCDVAAVEALPATRQLMARIDEAGRETPMALLGFHYVFEGSKNGGKHLAAFARRAYAMNDSAGTRYLDPYGDRQRETWAAFRVAMDAANFSAADQAAMTQAAKAAFAGITRMYDELYSAPAQTPVGV